MQVAVSDHFYAKLNMEFSREGGMEKPVVDGWTSSLAAKP